MRRLVLALGVLGVCGLVGEGAAGDWSAVYLKDNLGTSAGFAALAFAAFSVTMTLGRGAGDRLIRRFGVVSVIRVCGLIATAGLTLALATPARRSPSRASPPSAPACRSSSPRSSRRAVAPTRSGQGQAWPGWSASATPAWRQARRSSDWSPNKIGLQLALLIPLALAAWIAVAAPALAKHPGNPSTTAPAESLD